jgi:hypothetical protein
MRAEEHQGAQRIVGELRQLHSVHVEPEADCSLIITTASSLHNNIATGCCG